MKKLVIVALLALAVWQGWKHYPELRSKAPSHEAVIQNSSGQTLTRVRLSIGGQTFVKEEIAPDETATFPFRVNQDSQFSMTWGGRTVQASRIGAAATSSRDRWSRAT